MLILLFILFLVNLNMSDVISFVFFEINIDEFLELMIEEL